MWIVREISFTTGAGATHNLEQEFSSSAVKVICGDTFDIVSNFLNKPLFEGWPTDYKRQNIKEKVHK